MHEMGIAASIYEVAREAQTAQGPGHLTRIKVEVGELSAVDPDLLRYAWMALCEDQATGCTLEIEWIPAEQYCQNCNTDKNRAEGSWLRVCPDCGFPLQVNNGRQLDVIEIEMEEC
jgi:hydrogenase nickel incorporation protein HypA/HybF